MAEYKIENPEIFFAELGGAHDAHITTFSWDRSNNILTIGIDDLNSSFIGLPEYKGVHPVTLTFSRVSSFDIDIQFINDQLNIYSIDVDANGDSYRFNIKCSPGGSFKFECKNLQVLDLELFANQIR